ncbi:TPA: hypothetical protein ACH3X1_014625 [Trebouxia sp. C0004]
MRFESHICSASFAVPQFGTNPKWIADLGTYVKKHGKDPKASDARIPGAVNGFTTSQEQHAVLYRSIVHMLCSKCT